MGKGRWPPPQDPALSQQLLSPWQWSMFGTCAAFLLSPMLCHFRAYRSCSPITSQLSQSAVPQVSYTSQGKDFTLELSKWILQLQLGAVQSSFQGRGTLLSGTGFTAVFPPLSFLPGRSSVVPQSTYPVQPPAPSLLENKPANSVLNSRLLMTFFFFISASD